MKAEYLLFNLLILTFSTLGKLFIPRSHWPHIPSALIAICVCAAPFIIWDMVVTEWWWTFNPRYILGLFVGGLPMEEILFFLVIPWSCLVLWENMRRQISGYWRIPVTGFFTMLSVLFGFGGWMYSRWYSMSIGILFGCVTLLSLRYGRWFQQKSTIIFSILITVLTSIFNGYLTGRPVVTYMTETVSGIRVGTIPIEDFLYGWLLIGGVIFLYDQLYAWLIPD